MKSQAASETRHGMSKGMLDLMKRAGIPLTRENYLELEHMGNPPKHLTPEQESDLPSQFRKKD